MILMSLAVFWRVASATEISQTESETSQDITISSPSDNMPEVTAPQRLLDLPQEPHAQTSAQANSKEISLPFNPEAIKFFFPAFKGSKNDLGPLVFAVIDRLRAGNNYENPRQSQQRHIFLAPLLFLFTIIAIIGSCACIITHTVPDEDSDAEERIPFRQSHIPRESDDLERLGFTKVSL